MLLVAAMVLASLAASFVYGLHSGLIPARLSPLPPLNVADRDVWFLDWRLQALREDHQLCGQVLVSPLIRFSTVDPQPANAKGCGWSDAVRLERAAQVRIGAEPLTCPMAAAITMWMQHVVQPEARRVLGRGVAGVRHLGTYSCRPIVGSGWSKRARELAEGVVPRWALSQHAFANAIDIAAFELDDGEVIKIERDWTTGGPKAEFLHRVHDGACQYFRVTLGPDANDAHHDHFHLDRGGFSACR
jgi:hypothetical protein